MRVVSSSSAALALALMSSASSSTQAKTLSEYENEFAHWMAQHGHSFANNALEYARRLETYITNDLFINRHNAENKYSFTLGHNAYSHLTFDEFKQRYMGLRLAPGYVEQRLAQKPNGLLKHVDAPVSMDWVDKGGVTPVKNQGMCGSCWAFSTTGAVEGAAYVASGQLFSLSEQELVDCDDNGDMGCNGGLMDHAFQWIESHNGLCREEDYPYTAKQGVCKTTCEPVVKVTGYQDVDPNDESQLKAAVAQQPVSVAIEADQKEFQFYKSGVFDKKCGTQLDHGVLAVGYGAENGAKFWKVKNSWGDKWGENGYIRMSREAGSAHGQCGIAMVPSYPFASVVKHDTVARNTTMASAKSAVAGAMASVGSSAKITQCGDKTKSLVVFEDLEIAPTAPKRGKPVTFFGSGDIKKSFDTAVFQLDVRLAGERVFHHKGKICGDTHVPLPLGLGHIDVHGFQCPVAVGKFSDLKVDVNLPKIAPAGDYEIQFTSGDSTAAIDDLFCVHVDLDLTNHHTEEEKSKVYEPLMAVM